MMPERLVAMIGQPRRPMTMQQVADLIGLTKERVKQIEHKALAKLRRSGKLEEFYLESLYATGQEW